MPEPNTQNTGNSGDGAWRTQLPEALRSHEAFSTYPTASEMWTGVAKLYDDHKAETQKLTELQEEYDGFLENAIVRLPDDATDEDRNAYFAKLGRPEKPEEYEFEGEDKNAPEWTSYWKQTAHELGLTKAQAKALSAKFNGQMQQMVEAHNNALKEEMTAAEQKLKREMGDKFETNVELAKRMTQKHLGTEFDKTFANLGGEGRFGVVRLLLKVAELTGEDRSPQGGNSLPEQGGKASFIDYSKSPAPPKR